MVIENGAAARSLVLVASIVAGAAFGGCCTRTELQARCLHTPRTTGVSTDVPPGISGMAVVDLKRSLVIHDARMRDVPRAGLVTTVGRSAYVEVPILDGELNGGPLTDIEAVVAVPAQVGDFLVLESGDVRGRPDAPRRLAWLRFREDNGPELEVRASIDLAPSTRQLDDCEAIVCWRIGDQFRLAVAERGRMDHGVARARVMTGDLLLQDSGGSVRLAWTPDGTERTLEVRPGGPGDWRACSDLAIAPDGSVWGASAQDPGNHGPFRSRVFRVGMIEGEQLLLTAPDPMFDVEAIKVEALNFGGDVLWVGSDDEDFGGTWRPFPNL